MGLFDVEVKSPSEWAPADRVVEVYSPAHARVLTKRTLALAALDAALTLKQALKDPDPSGVRVRAAMAILDRTGFGPASMITIDDLDLSDFSDEQLLERIERLKQHIVERRMNDDVPVH